MNQIMSKRLISIFLIATILIISFGTIVMAEEDPIEQLEKHYKVNWDLVFQILGGPIGVAAIIITLIGIAAMVIVIGAVGWKAVMLGLGKGKFGKDEIKRFGIALIIAILITGSGAFSTLKFIDKNIVDPGIKTTTGDKINKTEDKDSSK